MVILVRDVIGGHAAVLPADADRLRNEIAAIRSGGRPLTLSWRGIEVVSLRFVRRALSLFADVQPPLQHTDLDRLDPMSREALAAVIARE
jgi:hypothetical protein